MLKRLAITAFFMCVLAVFAVMSASAEVTINGKTFPDIPQGDPANPASHPYTYDYIILYDNKNSQYILYAQIFDYEKRVGLMGKTNAHNGYYSNELVFNCSYKYTLDNGKWKTVEFITTPISLTNQTVFYSTVDLYYLEYTGAPDYDRIPTSQLFFQRPPAPAEPILTKAVPQNLIQTLTEQVTGVIPIILCLIVSLTALWKGLGVLRTLLGRA